MEATKLLKVLNDIVIEEKEDKVQNILNTLFETIQRSDTDNIDKLTLLLFSSLEDSRINDYTISNEKIIEFLKGDSYFGNKAKKVLEEIIYSEGYRISEKLNTYVTNRDNFIAKAIDLRDNLKKLGFKPHVYKEENYEIGFIFPNEFNNLGDISKIIKFWDRFLILVSEISGDDKENKLSFVNNGSLELFILKSFLFTRVIKKIMNDIADFYIKIQTIKKNKEEIKYLKNVNIEKEFDIEIKKRFQEFTNKITEEIIGTNNKIENNRITEVEKQFNNSIEKLIKYMDDGFNIEITPPEIDNPEKMDDEQRKDAVKYKELLNNYQKQLAMNKEIFEANEKFKSIGLIEKPLLSSEVINVEEDESKEQNEDSKEDQKEDQKDETINDSKKDE